MTLEDRVARAICRIIHKCDAYDTWHHIGTIDRVVLVEAATAAIEAHIAALADVGLVIVPIEPTNKMLTDVGPMEGFACDAHERDIDRLHIEWWQAMIAASLENDEQ